MKSVVRTIGLAVAVLFAAPQAQAYTKVNSADIAADTAVQYTVGLMCAAHEGDLDRVRAWSLYFAGQMATYQQKYGIEMAQEFSAMVETGTENLIKSGKDPCLGGVVSRYP